MTCSACAKRRKKLKDLIDKRRAKGKKAQAAALGAILTVTDTAAQVLGIKGEDDGRDSSGNLERAGEPDPSNPATD